MRSIINSTFITLDGVIEKPQDWPLTGGFGDTGKQFQAETLERCDAVLLGRHTYESFASVWSQLSGDPFGDRMNALPKYVVSTRLTDPTWNNTIVIDHDPIDAIRELKQQAGADIIQYGFGSLSHELMSQGLLDELHLWVHPFFLGTGSSDDVVYRTGSSGSFDLIDSKALDSGIIIVRYSLSQGG